jgi:hypothetical protein
MVKQKQQMQRLVHSKLQKAKRQFILTIGDDGAVLIYMNGTTLEQRLFVPLTSKADIKKMLAILLNDPKAPIAILMDNMDQSYTQQSLPAVSKLNITKLVRKKLDREYSGNYIKGAVLLGRAASGRKDWNYLFVASPSTPPLSSWLDVIIDLPNEISGIYLLPIELGAMVTKLEKLLYAGKNKLGAMTVSRWQIVITHNKTGGFRQAAFKDGKIVFSRLIHASGETSAFIIAGAIEQEFLNTIEYLRRLSFQESDGYDITVIASQEIKQALSEAVLKGNNTSVLTPFEAASKLGLLKAASQEDRYADVVIAAHFSQQRKHVLALHTPLTRKLKYIATAVRWSRIGMSWIIPLVLIMLISSAYEGYNINEKISQLQKERNDIQQKWQGAEKGTYSLQEAVKISDIVKLYMMLSGSGLSPLTVIADFNSIKGSDVLVKNINWQIKDVDKASGKVKGIKIILELEFINNSVGFDGLFENFDLFIKKVENKFSHYDVEYSRLPEKITFDEKNKIIPISVTISGPKDQPDKVQ